MNTYLVIADRIPSPSTTVWFIDMALSDNLIRNKKLCVTFVLRIVAFEFIRVTVHFVHCQQFHIIITPGLIAFVTPTPFRS
jgi:hypothetical protein